MQKCKISKKIQKAIVTKRKKRKKRPFSVYKYISAEKNENLKEAVLRDFSIS